MGQLVYEQEEEVDTGMGAAIIGVQGQAAALADMRAKIFQMMNEAASLGRPAARLSEPFHALLTQMHEVERRLRTQAVRQSAGQRRRWRY